jgi:hypothetical protein
MKFRTFSLTLATLALGAAAFAGTTHRVTFFQSSWVEGKELAPGDYKITVDNDKATISNGSVKVETPVKIETADQKFSSTAVRYQNGDGKYRLREIRVGGSKTRLVFSN